MNLEGQLVIFFWGGGARLDQDFIGQHCPFSSSMVYLFIVIRESILSYNISQVRLLYPTSIVKQITNSSKNKDEFIQRK